MKPGKNNCIVWDGTTILLALDIVMDQVTPVTREAPITFVLVKIQLYTDIYNMCVSHPNDVILLGMVATAIVFGSTTSASSWEPFRRAIEALSVAYANRPDLVITHKYYLNMISWAEHDPTVKITPAFPCLMNKGTLEANGNRAKLPARI
jgi:hypothetical protein